MFRKRKMKKRIKEIADVCNALSNTTILDYMDIKIYKPGKFNIDQKTKFLEFLFTDYDIYNSDELLLYDIIYNITTKVFPLKGINNSFTKINNCFFNTFKCIEKLAFDKFITYDKKIISEATYMLEDRFKLTDNDDCLNIESSIDIFKLLILNFILNLSDEEYKDYDTWFLEISALFNLFKRKKNISIKFKYKCEFIKNNKPNDDNIMIIIAFFNKYSNANLRKFKYKIFNISDDTIIIDLT